MTDHKAEQAAEEHWHAIQAEILRDELHWLQQDLLTCGQENFLEEQGRELIKNKERRRGIGEGVGTSNTVYK